MDREKVQKEIDELEKSVKEKMKAKRYVELFLNFLAVSMFTLFIFILANGGYNGRRIGYALLMNLDELEARQTKVSESLQEQIRQLQERLSRLEGKP